MNIELLSLSEANKVYGEHHAKECPICGTLTDEVGDLRNPSVLVYDEKICEECRKNLREIIAEKKLQLISLAANL